MFIKSAISDLKFSLGNDGDCHIASHHNGTNGKNGTNGNILIDTAGDIGLLAIMSLAACQTSLIPVATNVMGIQTLDLSLQRVEQVQRSLNSGLNKVLLVPSLFTRTRKAHQQCLEELKKGYSELLPFDESNEVVTILNRAEIENFIHESQHNLSKNSDILESIETIIKYLD
jgi:cellulose biosynthesis protein BcsQ